MMNIIPNIQHGPHMRTFLAVCVALSVTCFAQNKPVEEKERTKETTEGAWKLQVQIVAEDSGLSKDQTAKLTEAYLTARRSHKQALKELPEEADKDKARAATQEAVETDREKFLTSLKGVMSDELIAKVTPTLGSFNAKWDGFVIVLQDLKLNPATMKSALKFVITYVTEYETSSSESMKAFNRKPNSRPFKDKLDRDLSGLLSAEQMAQWKEATASSSGKEKSAPSEKKK
jgi:hypothetical protein